MKKIRITALLLLLVLCMSGCGKDAETMEKQETLKQEGMQFQAEGDYDAAIDCYAQALALANMKVGEEELDIAYYKASAQYRKGDTEGAIDTYSAILDVKKEEKGYLGRGLLYLAAGDEKHAKADFEKALNMTKDLTIQGLVFEAMDEKEKAGDCFEKAWKEGDTEALLYLSGIYESSGDHNYAMILLEEYIAGESISAEGYLRAEQRYFESGDYEKALEMVQAGICLEDAGVLKTLLQEQIACYEKLGDFSSAKAYAEAYLEQYPQDELIMKEYEFLKSR